MQLVSFRIRNFRSVNDSGDIKASALTALLGRNESGKSNILLALHALNPPDGFKPLNKVKDFPRHRRLEECTDATLVVESLWNMSATEQATLVAQLPRAKGVTRVTISRSYGGERSIELVDIEEQRFDEASIRAQLRKITPAVKAAAEKVIDGAKKEALEKAADTFDSTAATQSDPLQWAMAATPACAALRKALAAADVDLSEKQEQVLAEIEQLAKLISGDKEALAKARALVLKWLPTFIYLDDYPDLHGHQDVNDYLQKKQHNQLSNAERNFEKLCKVAGLDPAKLQELQGKNEAETRNQLANRASAVVTTEIRRLWKDRSLKVRFNLDANHFDTFISDPNATYDVEVNLDDRSRGFQWFFSFYITFAADTNGGNAENAILLLDEPGLYLHAKSQSDLLGHFEKDFKNQIIFTTHSPFMVPTHKLDAVRTVNIHEGTGTTVTNDPSGDARTLFPLQAALGYSLAQSLFVGPNNLVVEGVTDFWALSAASNYLADKGKIALAENLTITPAGGAQKVPYMVALLASEELNVLVLLDDENDAKATRAELVRNKLVAERSITLVSEAFGASPPTEADTEDLFDADTYEALVREAYKSELQGKILKLNSSIPRIAKRIESGLSDIGIELHKTRPMRLLLSKMAADPEKVMTPATIARFEALFKIVNERLQKRADRQVSVKGPFG